MVEFNGISFTGEAGDFSLDSGQICFIGSAGTTVTQQSSDIVAAEWFHGELSIQMASDEIFSFQGFHTVDFESLVRHFSAHFNLDIHTSHQVVQIQTLHFDEALGRIENNCAQMDESLPGSDQRKMHEVELVTSVEAMRDILENVVTGNWRPFDVFSANSCEGIRRLRSVIDIQQSKIHLTDQCWQNLQNHCVSIEAILQDPGSLDMIIQSHSSNCSDSKESLAESQIESPEDTSEFVEDNPTQTQIPEFASNDSLVEVITNDDVNDNQSDTMTSSIEEEFEIMSSFSHIRTVNAMTSTSDLHQLQNKCSIMKEGWLWKRSRHLNIWRKRWFVLTPHYLASFKNKGKAQPTECISAGSLLGVLPMDNVNLQFVWFRRKHEFCILCQGFSIVLAAEDQIQESEWISVMTAQMRNDDTW